MSPLLDNSNPQQPKTQESWLLRTLLPYTTVITLLVALYVGWTLYSRWSENRKAVEDAREKQASAEHDRNAAITQHGTLVFTTFYASDASIPRGGSTRLCYGVMNAKTLKIDPPIAAIQPTDRHCMDITPKNTTTYTITADDGAGHTKSSSLTVRVR